jgi:hypothetical protein
MKFNRELTRERLKEVLDYSKETGVFVWIKKPYPHANSVKVGQPAGTIQHGYTVIKIDNIPYKAHRLAWLYAFGVFPTEEIDHKNGNRSDNRFLNLREVSHAVNSRNQKKRSTNTSGFTGMCLRKKIIKGRVYESWEVNWKLPSGKQCGRSFSISKYGVDGAFDLAMNFKLLKQQELNAAGARYSERHGKQDAIHSPINTPHTTREE